MKTLQSRVLRAGSGLHIFLLNVHELSLPESGRYVFCRVMCISVNDVLMNWFIRNQISIRDVKNRGTKQPASRTKKCSYGRRNQCNILDLYFYIKIPFHLRRVILKGIIR